MKISYNWLKDYLKLKATPEEIAETLTSTGLEVEAIQNTGFDKKQMDQIVTGKVLELNPHPDADKLRLALVDTGNYGSLEIVCGAPNIEKNQTVAVALIGAVLYPEAGKAFTIKKAKIRGVESSGMICSEKELGIGEDQSGIMVLPSGINAGIPLYEALKLQKDSIFEIGLTPNRGDAASHIGTARDLSAFYKILLKLPEVKKLEVIKQNFPNIDIQIEDTEACPRYAGLIVKNLKVGPSPLWLQNRLRAIGAKPVNNIVDITNYVMQETGQPLHAFDLDKLKSGRIIVKTLSKGTIFRTLDDTERTLNGNELMICDGNEAIAMAGVMGGKNSMVTDNTCNIFLESACFKPVNIRRAAKKHQINSDAAFRYERGVDPNLAVFALQRLVFLLNEIADCEIINPVCDLYPNPVLAVEVTLNYAFLKKLSGIEIPENEIITILEFLGFEILNKNEKELKVKVPTAKTEVYRQVDVIEEILRIYSYDKISFDNQIKTSLLPDNSAITDKLKDRISNYLVANGFFEIYNNSIVNSAVQNKINSAVQNNINSAVQNKINSENKVVKILNPLSKELDEMRTSLLLPGLESIRYNINRNHPDLKFFEWGKVYHKKDNSYTESYRLALWITGMELKDSWHTKDISADFYRLKAYIQNIFKITGINNVKTTEANAGSEILYSLDYIADNEIIANVTEISPALLKKMDIEQPVYYADFDAQILLKNKNFNFTFNQLPKYPSVRRDLSMIVTKETKYADIRELIEKNGTALLREVSVFDVYTGKNLENSGKSYAVKMIFRDDEKTLKDQEVDAVIKKIIELLDKKMGVTVRQ